MNGPVLGKPLSPRDTPLLRTDERFAPVSALGNTRCVEVVLVCLAQLGTFRIFERLAVDLQTTNKTSCCIHYICRGEITPLLYLIVEKLAE